LPSGSHQRSLSRSVSHPSYRALFANSRDQRQRDNRLVTVIERILKCDQIGSSSLQCHWYFSGSCDILYTELSAAICHGCNGRSCGKDVNEAAYSCTGIECHMTGDPGRLNNEE